MTFHEMKKEYHDQFAIPLIGAGKMLKDRLDSDLLHEITSAVKVSFNRFKVSQLPEDQMFVIKLNGRQMSELLDAIWVYHETLNDYYEEEIRADIEQTVKALGRIAEEETR